VIKRLPSKSKSLDSIPSITKKKKKKKRGERERERERSWAYAYNPTYSGGRDQEDQGLKPAPGKQFVRLYLKNTQYKTKLVEWFK
jgi:hypothetical protein